MTVAFRTLYDDPRDAEADCRRMARAARGTLLDGSCFRVITTEDGRYQVVAET